MQTNFGVSKNFFFLVSHNGEHIFQIFEFEYLNEFENKIEILLSYHSGGPNEWFD